MGNTPQSGGRLALMLPKLSTYGGAERFGYDLAERLAGEGWAVDFICARVETPPPPGVRAVPVGRHGPFQVLKAAWFMYAAEQVRKKGSYDLSISLGKNWNQDVMRVGGGPLRNFWHLSKRAWPPGWARTWKMVRRRLRPANRLTLLVEARQYRSGALIIANSHRVREWILADHPYLNREDIPVIYNKPDLERFHIFSQEERFRLRAEAGTGAEETVIAAVASNFALKGIATLIETLGRLPGRFVLHVAGGRNPGKYQAQAEQLGVGHRVRFLGRVEDMPAFYNRADVFATATRYDACSNAVVEALACGLPAVSSKDNGSAWFLPEECVVDDPLDAADFALKIETASMRGRTPFVWPDDVACGLEPYVGLVARLAAQKSGNKAF